MTELDSQITSRDELVALIDDRWARWCHTVDNLTPEEIDTPGTCGHWSAKDLVGHVATWDQVAIDNLQAILQGKTRQPWDETMDEFNERMARSLEHEPFASLRQMMDQTHARLREVLDGASGASDEQVQAMLESLPADTWEHYDVHRQQIVERFGEPTA
ncbi:MAG TPA: DinB family protein [Thermomicrobiales bacterium]|nr:DinB family protein [Thermomicrobiales bacterium]